MTIIPQENIDAQAFISALTRLNSLATASTTEQAQVTEKYGSLVADDMAHGSPTEIGHALVELIGTIPGSNLSIDAKNRQHSAGTLVSSYKSVDAEIDRRGDHGIIEATVGELNTDVIQLNIRRSGKEGTKCAVNLDITDTGELKIGNLWFRLAGAGGTVEFDKDGNVNGFRDDDNGKLRSKFEGKKLAIAKVINSVTGRGQLGEDGDIQAIFNSELT